MHKSIRTNYNQSGIQHRGEEHLQARHKSISKHDEVRREVKVNGIVVQCEVLEILIPTLRGREARTSESSKYSRTGTYRQAGLERQ